MPACKNTTFTSDITVRATCYMCTKLRKSNGVRFVALRNVETVFGRTGKAYNVPQKLLVGWEGNTPPYSHTLVVFGVSVSAPSASRFRRIGRRDCNHCIHEVDEQKTDETVHALFRVFSLLADSDSDFNNKLKMVYAVFTPHLVK